MGVPLDPGTLSRGTRGDVIGQVFWTKPVQCDMGPNALRAAPGPGAGDADASSTTSMHKAYEPDTGGVDIHTTLFGSCVGFS